jgi:hypothetical protein
MRHTEAGEERAHELPRAAVAIGGEDHVVAALEKLEQRSGHRRHAAREQRAILGPLERGNLPLRRADGRIPVAPVLFALGVGVLAALGLLYTVGYLASSYILGRRIMKPTSSRYAAFLVGWLILRIVALIPILGGLAWIAASAFGLGALAVAARTGATAAPPAAAPPLPPAPEAA